MSALPQPPRGGRGQRGGVDFCDPIFLTQTMPITGPLGLSPVNNPAASGEASARNCRSGFTPRFSGTPTHRGVKPLLQPTKPKRASGYLTQREIKQEGVEKLDRRWVNLGRKKIQLGSLTDKSTRQKNRGRKIA
jgi:hypothetical protein